MSPKGSPRQRSLKVTLTDEEHAQLMVLAHNDGLPAAMWLRQYVRKQWAEREDAQLKRALAQFLKENP